MKHISIKTAVMAGLIVGAAFTGNAQAQNNALANGVPFNALQMQITDLQSYVEKVKLSLQNQIDSANVQIATLTDITGDNSSDIAALEEQVSLLKSQLAMFQDNLSQGCSDGYFVQSVKQDGTPVCARDSGSGRYYIEELFVTAGVPYILEQINCPASYPKILNGGYVETPTTSVVGSYAVFPDGKPNAWMYVINGVGATLLRAVCTN